MGPHKSATVVILLLASMASPGRASQYDIVINEINYNPFTGDDKDEFVEVFNRGATAVDLSGWTFTEGIYYNFSSGQVLGPGDYLVVCPDAARAKSRFGIENLIGNYVGKLDNTGEILTLANAQGVVISRVHYSDGSEGAWPDNPDGVGPTLELVEPYKSNDLPQAWSSSLALEGTPGRPNSRFVGPDGAAVSRDEVKRTVVLNEVAPSEGGHKGFIELYNRTAASIDVGGWRIVDSRGTVPGEIAFAIPSPQGIGPGERLLFDEDALGFAPASSGARYALLDPEGAWRHGTNPQPGPTWSSFGSHPDGDEDGFVMTTPSPGTANSVVLERDIVIDEILYHPPFVAPSGDCTRQCSNPDQWIEIHNRGTSAKDLSDWTLSKGIDFRFPVGTSISAGGYLVVAADRARFLAKHPALDEAKVIGGWTRKLSRSTDTINLNDALGNRADHVEYGDGEPINDVDPEDGTDDRTLASSDWPRGPDGNLGKSLELTNPSLDNRAGAAWSTGPNGGTPLARNSTHVAAPGPLVWDVSNEPAIPRSTEPVAVTCNAAAMAPATVTKVEVLWHLDGSTTVTTATLRDDGNSGDKESGDGIYGGTIPAQAAGKLIAFQVKVTASDGKTSTIPRSPAVAPYTGFKGPYFLCAVDNAAPLTNGAANYRILMTAADQSELTSRDVESNVLLPCTFIGDGKAFHTGGIRVRGKGSRTWDPHPWRINLPPDRKFRGNEKVNLVPNYPDTEILSADLFRRAGLPVSQEWMVNLTFKAISGGEHIYAFKEAVGGDFLDRWFGGSSGGNLYRSVDPSGTPEGDFTYYGTDPDSYRDIYVKKSNVEEDDYTDVIDLCRTFDPVQTPDSQFATMLAQIADVDEWSRFFALHSCVSNNDGSIETNNGEDFFLYRVPADSPRPDAGKWLILPWDVAETFRNPEEGLFRPELLSVRRFLTNPAFAPLYYGNLQDLRDGVFSLSEMRKSAYLIEPYYGDVLNHYASGLSAYVNVRDAFYDRNIPGQLTAGFLGDTTYIAVGDTWRYFKGKSEPSAGNRNWTNRTGFSDASWLQGPTGIGYDDGDDATVLSDMEGSYTTVYARKTFTVAEPASLLTLSLDIDYDDGFVAYLNGTEVARKNAPGSAGSFVAYNGTATATHEAGTAEKIDITASKGLLVAGSNVLAVQVLNEDVDSSDFSFIPELASTVVQSGGGCGEILYTTAATATLSGQANSGRTAQVQVNGTSSTYDPFKVHWSAGVSLALGSNAVQVKALDAAGAVVETLDLQVIRLARNFTSVSGTLAADASWTEAGGPYMVASNLTVPAGRKLSIGPGAAVIFQAGSKINVQGTLEALGTSDEPIIFRPYSCAAPLGGVSVASTGTASGSPVQHFRFVDVEFGKSAGSGVISVTGSKLLVEDCAFRDASAAAIGGSNSRIEIHRTVFERLEGAVKTTGSTVTVVDCTASGIAANAVAIDLEGPALNGERSLVERTVLEDGRGRGIELSSIAADLRDGIIRDFQDRGVTVDGTNAVGPVLFAGTIVQGCGTGLAIENGATVSGDHDTIAGNGEGIAAASLGSATDGGHGEFDSLIVWDNLMAVRLGTKSTVLLDYSDLSEAWPGTANISADPLFKAPEDLSLSPGSPAIGSGFLGTDMGAIPSGPPIGFVRGDADAGGSIGLPDVMLILGYLYQDQAGPSCLDRLDANDDGAADLSDALYLLFYMYAGGAAPRAPFPEAGPDPTPDGLSCQ